MTVEGIKVVDATLRDGGPVNDFFFDESFVQALYEASLTASVDYMEFGYGARKSNLPPTILVNGCSPAMRMYGGS